MIVLYIFLLILALIFAIILLLLFSQIRVKILFDGEFSVKVYYGFFKIPARFLEKNSEKVEKIKPKNAEKIEKSSKKRGFFEKFRAVGASESLKLLRDLLKPLTELLKDFSKHIKINPLICKITLADEDAAKLAIDYGKFCAVFYPLLSLIVSNCKVKNCDEEIKIDFSKQKTEVFVKTTVKIRPVFIIKNLFKVFNEFSKIHAKFT